jgi:hypothetical protein
MKMPEWFMPVVASAGLSLAAWAHTIIMAHETKIAILQDNNAAKEKRLDNMDAKLDQILKELRDRKP